MLCRSPDYVPPKKPYSFLTMLDDILEFSSQTLVDNGRLSFWMPTANDQDQEIKVPEHPSLAITSVCTQAFNKCEFPRLKHPLLDLTSCKGPEDLSHTAESLTRN